MTGVEAVEAKEEENSLRFNASELNKTPFNDLVLILNEKREGYELFYKNAEARSNLEFRMEHEGIHALPKNSAVAKWTSSNPNILVFSKGSAQKLARLGAVMVFDRGAFNGITIDITERSPNEVMMNISPEERVVGFVDELSKMGILATNYGDGKVGVGDNDVSFAAIAAAGAQVPAEIDSIMSEVCPGLGGSFHDR